MTINPKTIQPSIFIKNKKKKKKVQASFYFCLFWGFNLLLVVFDLFFIIFSLNLAVKEKERLKIKPPFL